MQIKISKMALLTMPCFVALSLAACGGSSSHSSSDNFDPVAPSKFSSGSATPTSPTGLTAPEGDEVKEVEPGYVVLQWLGIVLKLNPILLTIKTYRYTIAISTLKKDLLWLIRITMLMR